MQHSGLSYWERESFMDLDIAIVGGGIVGMSVAASIKDRWPQRQVTIIERGCIPYGASTRNAGFACFGSLTEIVSDLDIMGADQARKLLFNRWLGLKITRERLKSYDISYEDLGGFEIVESSLANSIDRIAEINELVEDFILDYIQLLKATDQPGLRLNDNQHLVSMSQEGQVDTGKLLKALHAYCISIGVEFICGSKVKNFEALNGKTSIHVKDPIRGDLELKALQCVVCTNAFTQKLLPNIKLNPGRGQVLITEPIDGLQFRGNLHIDEGFYYMRNVGDRILFGGGRNLDFDAENTIKFGLNNDIQHQLDQMLLKYLRLKEQPKIDIRWSGIMAFGKDKMPIVRLQKDGLIIATKMSGMGIALAGQIGEEVVDIFEENNL